MGNNSETAADMLWRLEWVLVESRFTVRQFYTEARIPFEQAEEKEELSYEKKKMQRGKLLFHGFRKWKGMGMMMQVCPYTQVKRKAENP